MEGLFIPIVLFIVVGIIMLGYFYWNHKNRAHIMETVRKALDMGGELNSDMLKQLGAAGDPRFRDMRRGVVFLSLGVAGLLCSLFFVDPDVVNGIRAGSVFPLMLGIGFLIVWRLNKD